MPDVKTPAPRDLIPPGGGQCPSQPARKADAFFKNVLTLFSGTASGQILSVAAAPVLTRIFSPGDFGEFGLFFCFVSVAATIVTLRYSHAILLPENDAKALQLSALCLLVSLGWACGAAVLAGSVLAFGLFPGLGARGWIAALPVATLLAGVQATLYTVANRARMYRLMSASKVAQAAGTIGLSILLGVSPLKSTGLILGYIGGQLLAVAALATAAGPSWRDRSVISLAEIRQVALRYRNFALLSLPADLLNSTANQISVLFIAHYFGATLVGYYNLTFRVMLGPLGMVSAAILDVFKEQAARDYARTGDCRAVFLRTAKALTLAAAPALVLFYPFAPNAFALAFGPEWRTAGEFAQILTPLLITRFIASPLSYMIYIAEKQIYDLVWQAGLLSVVCLSFVLGGMAQDIVAALRWFSWLYSLMYLLYFYLSYRFTVRKPS